MERTGGDGNDLNERSDCFFTLRRWTGAARIREPGKTADRRWFFVVGFGDVVGSASS